MIQNLYYELSQITTIIKKIKLDEEKKKKKTKTKTTTSTTTSNGRIFHSSGASSGIPTKIPLIPC